MFLYGGYGRNGVISMKKYVRILLLSAAFAIAYSSIAVSIIFSPWFSWSRNALSDLGHCIKSDVAVIFNFGLVMSGLMLALYSTIYLRKETKLTWILLFLTGFMLQLIGVYDEIYGRIHVIVSTLFFILLDLSPLAYSLEKKIKIGVLLFLFYLLIWIAYYVNMLKGGIAIPEFITSFIAAVFLISKEFQAAIRERAAV